MEIILFLCILTASFVLTYLYRKLAIKKAILDIPNHRSSHLIPTPRGGGIAIVISWFLSLIYLFLTDTIEANLFYAFLAGLPLAIIGIIDDLYSISAKIRFAIQFLSAALGLYFLGGVHSFDLVFIEITNQIVLIPLFFVGFIWFINLYNFLDGIDGYASMQSLFFAVAFYTMTSSILSICLASAVLGFFLWNKPKAKIFMGDVGSTSLGYIIFVVGVYFNNIGDFSFVVWLAIMSLFWFDATVTLLKRFLNKEKLTEGHKKHAYQRAVLSGLSHAKTVAIAFTVNLIILFVVYCVSLYEINMLFVLFFALIVNGFLYRKINKLIPFANDTL